MKRTLSGKFHYGWVIVFVGFILYGVVMGCVVTHQGLFFTVVSEEFGASRGQFSLASTAILLSNAFLSIFIGRIYRKFTIRRTMLISSLILPVMVACYGLAPNLPVYCVLSFVSGCCLCSLCAVGVSTIVTNWFNEKRGFAVAVAGTGTGALGIFLNPLFADLIVTIGWRKSYFVMAAIIAVAVIPCTVFLVRDDPADIGLEPYGGIPVSCDPTETVSDGMTLQEAHRSPVFWMMAVVMFLAEGLANPILQHTPPYATDLNYTYAFGSSICSLIIGCLAVSKIVLGRIYDVAGSKNASVFAMFTFLTAMVLYLFAQYPACFYAAAVIIGCGIAFSSLGMTILCQDLFGKKDFAGIFGHLYVFGAVGGMISCPVVGAVFDNMGSYRPAWAAMAVLSGVCILMIVLSCNYARRKGGAQY